MSRYCLTGENAGRSSRDRVDRDKASIGGLAGINSGTIIASYSGGVMSGNANRALVGGLVEINSGAIIANYSGV